MPKPPSSRLDGHRPSSRSGSQSRSISRSISRSESRGPEAPAGRSDSRHSSFSFGANSVRSQREPATPRAKQAPSPGSRGPARWLRSHLPGGGGKAGSSELPVSSSASAVGALAQEGSTGREPHLTYPRRATRGFARPASLGSTGRHVSDPYPAQGTHPPSGRSGVLRNLKLSLAGR